MVFKKALGLYVEACMKWPVLVRSRVGLYLLMCPRGPALRRERPLCKFHTKLCCFADSFSRIMYMVNFGSNLFPYGTAGNSELWRIGMAG